MAIQALPRYVNAMAYKYKWLSQALDDMAEEIGYVKRKFGDKAARDAEARIRERVEQLRTFPYSGVLYENLLYGGKEVRALHIKQISVIYAFHNEVIILIAVWNNYHNPNCLSDIIGNR